MKPLVLGHRGASGYRPENTLEAFELAIIQGADGVECDLVPTKDGELIIRHENWLNGTTNIASIAKFDSKKRSGYSDGLTEEGFFSEDFDFSELAEVRAIERLPELRPGSSKFDGQFMIPTIDQLLEADYLSGKVLVIEVKHGRYFTKQGIDVAGILASKIESSNWRERNIQIVVESFDIEMLRLLKIACGKNHKYVFLTEEVRLPDPTKPITDEYLAEIAADFDGISVDLPMLFDFDERNQPIDNGVIDRARRFGLEVYCWTLKAEDATESVEEYFGKVASAPLDGIFVDQPDLLRFVVDGKA